MTLTALLFAGGESRRMGVDKATLDWAGRPLWQHQCRTLQALAPRDLLISARERPHWCPPEIEVVLDVLPARGPLGGLAAALQRCTTSHLLTLAIDQPQACSNHLAQVWSHASPGVGVVPIRSGQLEPLCAVYPTHPSCLRTAQDCLAAGRLSLRPLLWRWIDEGLMRPLGISSADSRNYTNLNTPEEYHESRRSSHPSSRELAHRRCGRI